MMRWNSFWTRRTKTSAQRRAETEKMPKCFCGNVAGTGKATCGAHGSVPSGEGLPYREAVDAKKAEMWERILWDLDRAAANPASITPDRSRAGTATSLALFYGYGGVSHDAVIEPGFYQAGFNYRNYYPDGRFSRGHIRYMARAADVLAQSRSVKFISETAEIDERILRTLQSKRQIMESLMNTKTVTVVEFLLYHHRLNSTKPGKAQAMHKAVSAAFGPGAAAIFLAAKNAPYAFSTVRCTPEQFSQFIIARAANDGENLVGELKAKSVERVVRCDKADPEGLIDVTGLHTEPEKTTKVEYYMHPSATDFDWRRAMFNTKAEYWARANPPDPLAGIDPVLLTRVRDNTLEEIAADFDRRAARTQSKLMFAPPGYQKMGQKAVCRLEHNAALMRSMKGGVSAAKAGREADAIHFRDRIRGKFHIKFAGRPVVAYFVAPLEDSAIVKIDGEHTYVHWLDEKLNWDTARPASLNRTRT